MNPLSDLIARLKTAKEGSEEISRKIAEALGWRQEYVGDVSRGYFVPRYVVWFDPSGVRKEVGQLYPPFSQSFDVAMTLLPPDLMLNLYWDGKIARVTLGPRQAPDFQDVEAATPALALCIAILETREAGQ